MGPYELLKEVVKILENLKIPYFVTGSVAAMAYGEIRHLTAVGLRGYGELHRGNHTEPILLRRKT